MKLSHAVWWPQEAADWRSATGREAARSRVTLSAKGQEKSGRLPILTSTADLFTKRVFTKRVLGAHSPSPYGCTGDSSMNWPAPVQIDAANFFSRSMVSAHRRFRPVRHQGCAERPCASKERTRLFADAANFHRSGTLRSCGRTSLRRRASAGACHAPTRFRPFGDCDTSAKPSDNNGVPFH